MTRWRRPAWWSVLLTVAAAVLFVRLGVWQLDRADYKETLVRRYAAAATAPPVPFDRIAAAPPAEAFPRVVVHGHWLGDRVYLLDNPRHDAHGGVEVYAPLALPDDSRLLLVDLGFLPGAGRAKLPPLPAGEASLHGLYLPPPGVGLELGGDALAGQTQWPKTTIYLDLDQVAGDLGRPLYPRVLALDADPAVAYQRVHAFDFSSMPPSRHRAYAFQWFSLAVAVLAIFLVLHRKRRPRRTDNR
ncbi:SURF1 family protein [Frateuria hangzhouensis]|uniref:SURF1 family protein n=1 Tax=Frateuria hangzhouensis TaxID=2995589 RepID=UPI002260AB7C|nr:SURF1 family protein [Frateuria sp. STR12]MCX7512704.1 SURF1 family protein [Frateuria sp. STR12]